MTGVTDNEFIHRVCLIILLLWNIFFSKNVHGGRYNIIGFVSNYPPMCSLYLVLSLS